ncbi:MAG: fatty acid desaturase [Acidiferrobacterales bacterium]|nr:fatty acid desaturase [Acidiferrobacterales bacterium]
MKNDWYLCEIDKRLLRLFSERRDGPPMIWFGSYFALLVAFGFAVAMTWGSWWVVAMIIVYSALWGCAASAVHETCHKTPFRTRFFNELTLWTFGAMVQMEPISTRWGHLGHHSFTHFDEGDTELSEPNPVTWAILLRVGSGIDGNLFYWKSLLAQSCGRITQEMLAVIPPKKGKKAIQNARIMIGAYALVIVWAAAIQSWLPIVLVFAPRFIGGPVTGILHLTQHTCLQMNVKDHRYSTRSFTAGPITRFFYFNMNHHIEHHMFPMVPFYNLPKLSAALSSQLPEPCKGLWGVYREIFAGVMRQRKDPSYYIEKVVPQ